MVTTKLSLADYLSLDNGPEGRCEFVDGDILELPPESPRNVLILMFLIQQFLSYLPFYWLRRADTEILVSGRLRIPDVMILGEELAMALENRGRSTITEEMPPPLLVVEVVSPGKINEDRDYRYKRSEYAARGIPEYWIVDPEREKVTVLTLVDGWYEPEKLGPERVLESPQVPGFSVSVARLLSPRQKNP